MVKYNEPCDWSTASSYEHSLLGSLFAMSPCPQEGKKGYGDDFFSDVDDNQDKHAAIQIANEYIWHVGYSHTCIWQCSFDWINVCGFFDLKPPTSDSDVDLF